MNVNEIFGDDKRLNTFYSQMASIAEMAVSKHANLLLDPILRNTAQWAHDNLDILEKIAPMGVDAPAKAAEPEHPGALDEEVQAEQKTSRDCQDSIQTSCPDVDCTGSYNFDQDSSSGA